MYKSNIFCGFLIHFEQKIDNHSKRTDVKTELRNNFYRQFGNTKNFEYDDTIHTKNYFI